MTRRGRNLALVVVGVLVVAALAAYYFQYPQRQRDTRSRGDGPVPVLAAAARTADVPVYLEGVGTTRALKTVTVRTQVDGKLIAVLYKEGQEVKRGDVLARIDPTTYKALLDQAVAKKAQDEANLANARIDLDRYTRLAATNSINKQQLDTQRALVAQLEALVKLDQGAIDNAQAYLNWTSIVAPIDGRTGIRLVDEGNIVNASDPAGIVVLTQIQPISVLFTLPQQQLGIVNKAFAKGPLTVEALGPDNKTVIDRGTLQVVDNLVDQLTGTIKLKAEFPNPELQLWPGQFVNVRLLIDTLRDVVVVPTAALQRGPSGPFVYVAQPDDTAAVRPVTITQQDETQAVIASGVQAAERVITTGFSRLTGGARISVASASETPVGATGRPEGGRKGGPRPEGGRGEGRRGPRAEGKPSSTPQ